MNFLLFFGQNLDIAAELDYFKNFWEHFLITKFDCASFAPLAITVSWKLTELERICGRGVPWNMKPECDILSYLLHKIDYRSFLYSVFCRIFSIDPLSWIYMDRMSNIVDPDSLKWLYLQCRFDIRMTNYQNQSYFSIWGLLQQFLVPLTLNFILSWHSK